MSRHGIDFATRRRRSRFFFGSNESRIDYEFTNNTLIDTSPIFRKAKPCGWKAKPQGETLRLDVTMTLPQGETLRVLVGADTFTQGET